MRALFEQLLERRLLFVTGKGGVGKTSVSAALALANARQGRKTLWVEMSDVPRGRHLFPGYIPGYEPRRIERDLWGMNLTFPEALEEYLELKFRVPFIARMVAKNNLFRAFTTALPGLDALVTTGRVWYEQERREGGAPAWDAIVVDAPATGHGLALLKFPHAALDIVKVGPVAQAAREIDRLLADSLRTALVVVTILEALPVDEAEELMQTIADDTGYEVAGVVANHVYPQVGAPAPQRYTGWLSENPDAALDDAFGTLADQARGRLQWLEGWHRMQQQLLPRLQAWSAPHALMPWMPAATEPDVVEALWKFLHGDADENTTAAHV